MKPIQGFPGYFIDSEGRVFTVKRCNRFPNRTGPVEIHQGLNTDGYRMVGLWKDGRRRTAYPHKMVLEAFVGPASSTGFMACHRNGIRTDNRVENLYWGTHRQNSDDTITHGKLKGQGNPNAKLTEEVVKLIQARLSAGETNQAIAADFGVTHQNVNHIRKGSAWTHVTAEEAQP